ncbi:MAG: hypothetical protein AB7D26_06940 [Marinobacterium sp.]
MAMIRSLTFCLALASASVMASGSCPDGTVEAVELITQHETTLLPGSKGLNIRGEGRGQVKHYFSVGGEEYIHEDSERRIPTGILETGGFAYRWAPFEKETWQVDGYIYRSSKGDKRDYNKRSQTAPRDHNPAVAIEEISAKTDNTDVFAGHRCRVSTKTIASGATVSSCSLRIYGRNTPIDWQIVHEGGSKQTKQTLSLTQKCVDTTVFEIPERNWQ